MSKCIFCGKSAGLLSKSHKECETKYKNGKSQILQEIANYFNSPAYQKIEHNLNKIAEISLIQKPAFKQLLLMGYNNAVDYFLDDGTINDAEFEKLENFGKTFDITEEELTQAGIQQKIVKSVILNEAINNEISESRVEISGTLPFVFEKNEILLWLFNNAELHQLKTKTHYSGGSQGVSIKLTKGVYYRAGSFKGQPIKTEEIECTGTGMLALTNQNLYYYSFAKSLKIKYNQIISMPTFEDAIGIQQVRANSKTIYFKNIDTWFMYNLISNLIRNQNI